MWALLALGSAFFDSASSYFEKKVLFREHAMEFCSAMSLIATLLTSPLWPFINASSISLYAVALVLAASITFALSLLFFAKSARHLAASYTNPFLALAPLLVAIISLLFTGEILTLLQWVGLFVLSFGAYALYSHSHKSIFDPLKKAHKLEHFKYTLLGVLFFSVTCVLEGSIVGKSGMGLGVLQYLTLSFFLTSIIFILMMLLFHDGFSGIGNGMRKKTLLLLVSAILTLSAKALFVWAISSWQPVVLISVLVGLKATSAIFTTWFDGDLLHKTGLFRKVFFAILILAGATLLLM